MLIAIAIFVSSCYTTGKYESGIAYSNNYLLISPIFIGGRIVRANSVEYDSTLSSIAEKTLTECVYSYRDVMRFTDTLSAPEHVKINISKLDNVVSRFNSKKIGNLPTPPDLDSLIESNGYRYGMVIIGNGFSRPIGNTIGWSAMAVVTGALTGAYMTPRMNNCCTVHAFVIDASEHKIISAKTSGYFDKNPTKKGVVETAFKKTFNIRN